MERWRGKVAVVTGASSGIGLAIAKRLVREGLTVVGFDIQIEKLQNEIKCKVGPGKLFARVCDVSKETDVDEAFDYIKKKFKTVHILINNAGILRVKSIEEADMKELRDVVNVNFIGVLHCTKRAIQLMREKDHESHIINMNSIAGHKVFKVVLPGGVEKMHSNIYAPTKYAITSLSDVLTNELQGGKIRITSLSPGFVNTGIGGGIVKEKFGENALPFLNLEDITDAIVYVVGVPRHVQISELIIRPLGEFF